MIKKFFSFILICCLLVISLTGCSKEKEMDPKQGANDFVNTLYTIRDYQHPPDINKAVKSLFTEEEYQAFVINRAGNLPISFAQDLRVNMEVKDILFKIYKKEKGSIVYNYTANIFLTNDKNKTIKKIKKKGQIKVVLTEDKWLIDNIWSEHIKLPNSIFPL